MRVRLGMATIGMRKTGTLAPGVRGSPSPSLESRAASTTAQIPAASSIDRVRRIDDATVVGTAGSGSRFGPLQDQPFCLWHPTRIIERGRSFEEAA